MWTKQMQQMRVASSAAGAVAAAAGRPAVTRAAHPAAVYLAAARQPHRSTPPAARLSTLATPPVEGEEESLDADAAEEDDDTVDIDAEEDAAPPPLPLSLDSPSIDASKLSSYLSLLPKTAINEAYLKQAEAAVEVQKEEEVITHAPLRTRLKADMKFSIPSFDAQHTVRTLPFSLDSYRNLLAQPFHFERAANATTPGRTYTKRNPTRALAAEELERVIVEVTTDGAAQYATLTRWIEAQHFSHVLTVLNALSERNQHAAVCQVYQTIIRSHADATVATLDQYATGSSASSASSVLAFLRSLHRPKLLDHSAALTLVSAMHLGDTTLAREVVGKVARWQRAQAQAFEAVQWSFGVELTKPTDSEESSDIKQVDFQPHSTHPYMAFMESLLLTKQENVVTSRGRKRRQLRKQARAALAAGVPIDTAVNDLPKVKPALQLFNRLVNPPAGGGSFSLGWNRLARTMLNGVVDIAANEARELKVKHAALFAAADARPRTLREADPLSQFTLAEVVAALDECATKKREALDLVEGIAMHVLQSFVAKRTTEATGPSAVPAAPPAQTAEATDAPATPAPVAVVATSSADAGGNHQAWRLIKLLLCTRDALHGALPIATHAYRNGYAWAARQSVTMTRTQLLGQRDLIRRALLETDAIYTPYMLNKGHFFPTPELQRAASKMKKLQQLHVRLLHTALQSFIHVATDFASLEGAAERLRVRAEHMVARREDQLRREEAGGIVSPGSLAEFQTKAAALNTTPLPSSPVKHVHAILVYAATESIALDRHALTLLFHKGLFGGGLRPSVRYASFSRTGAASKGEADEFHQVLGMLDSCGPAFRRIPTKVHNASSDFISSLLIDHLLPKPITLFDLPKHHSAAQPQGRLFEAYATASMNVLDKQRRRAAKAESLAAARATLLPDADATATETTEKPATPAAAPNALASRLPFTVLRDQSGVLARLHGSLEYVHAHPLHPALDRHVASRNHEPRKYLTSTFLNEMRFGFALARAQQIAAGSGDGRSLNNFRKTAVQRKQLKRLKYIHQMRQLSNKQNAPMIRNMRARHLALLKKNTAPRAIRMPNFTHVAKSFIQIPPWIVSPAAYSALLIYHDQCNDLPSAVNLLDRMRHQWVVPSFRASCALLSLAAKFMNYELMVYYFTQYAMPQSAGSSSKRARIWKTMLHSMARYNSYSNVDVYMRYMQDLLYEYLLKSGTRAAAATPAPTAISDASEEALAAIEAQAAGLAVVDIPTAPTIVHNRTMANSFDKRTLDSLWSSWVARGGASEVLSSWHTIRQEQDRAPLKSRASNVLDDDSIDAFLDGLLIAPTPGKDAVTKLTSAQVVEASGLLMRHLATHSLQLTPKQIDRVAIDLPLLLATLRGSPTHDVSLSSFAGGSRPLRVFAAMHGVPDSVVEAALGNTPASDQRDSALRTATLDMPMANLDLAIVTPSSVRAHVIAGQLRDLNQAIGPNGVDATIERLERLLGTQTN